jgi:hypothetical protein
MANLTERITNIEHRIKIIEDMLGIDNQSYQPKQIIQKNEPEETINGFSKSQLRFMFNWAKNTKIQHLSRSDFDELKKWGMLIDFYPDAPDNYDDIKL